MNLKSKKTSLLILGVTAIVFSRIMFLFFNDPEGPNLLVIMGAAVIIFLPSLSAYVFNLPAPKKLVLAIFIQILIVTGLYFFGLN